MNAEAVTMLEKMARAAYERPSSFYPLGRPGAWERTAKSARKTQLLEDMRAALTALREPDEGMLRAVRAHSDFCPVCDYDGLYAGNMDLMREVYRAMIDHILAE